MLPKDNVMFYAPKKKKKVCGGLQILLATMKKTINRMYFPILTNHNLAISEMQF